MGYLEHQIDEMLSFLDREEKRYSIAFAKGPKGTLQKGKVNGRAKYMHCVRDDTGKRRYMRRIISHEPELIRSLASKEYARVALKQIDKNKHYVEQMGRCVEEVDREHIINTMKSAYRTLPPKCFAFDQEGAGKWDMQRQWAAKPYKMSDYRPEKKTKSTSRGLDVRSKSEALLIEKLYEYEIPFRYEQVMRVGHHELVPDITFLDRNGREFYLEYCGMMDDVSYVDRFLWKRGVYESIGICQWENMIYIFEQNNEIHLDYVDNLIRREIIPRL